MRFNFQKFTRITALVVVTSSQISQGATPFRYDANPRSEAKMVTEVRAALEFTRQIDTQWIEIHPNGPGKVQLSGQVPSTAQKKLVMQTVRQLKGIRAVQDDLKVGPISQQTDPFSK